MADIDDTVDDNAKVDQIMALLEKTAEAAPVEAAPAPESEPEVEGQPPAPDEDAAPEAPASGEEPEPEQEAPAIEPPVFWDSEAKTEFAKLSPSVQRKIVERERERDRTVSVKSQEAAEATKLVEQSKAERQQQLARMKELEDSALGDPIIQWGDKVDWVKLATEVEPATYNQYRAHYDQRRGNIARLQYERRSMEQQALNTVMTEAQKQLATILGDEFTDDAKWRPLVKDVVEYLRENDVPKEYWDGIEDRKIRNAKEFKVLVDAVKGQRLLRAKESVALKKVSPAGHPAAKPRAALPPPKIVKPLQAKITRALQTRKTADAVDAVEAAIRNG